MQWTTEKHQLTSNSLPCWSDRQWQRVPDGPAVDSPPSFATAMVQQLRSSPLSSSSASLRPSQLTAWNQYVELGQDASHPGRFHCQCRKIKSNQAHRTKSEFGGKKEKGNFSGGMKRILRRETFNSILFDCIQALDWELVEWDLHVAVHVVIFPDQERMP